MIRLLRRSTITIHCKEWANSGRIATYIKVRTYGSKEDIAPAYKPSLVETESAARASSTALNSSARPGPASGKPYNILLPPPNVTGELHLGHALTCAVQDALVRYAHNNGHRAIWTPGMDHAGIATQVVVEKRLQKERNLSRHELGREKFLEEVMRWKIEKEGSIRNALQQMGCTMDWGREYFTMDPQQSIAVKDAFVQLFEKGLIYRDRALVNWSCSLESAISDVEVENMEIDGPTTLTVPGYQQQITFGRMVDIAYKVQGSTEEIIVSTTRPETFLGDVAVAVHPEDGRYSHLRNKATFLWHPVRKEEIPLIFDTSVDRSFGTGAVKITPAHDRFDFELGRKHQLATIEVIDERGIVQEHLGPFSGLPRYEARERLLEYFSKLALLRGIKPHSMILPICSRSKDVVELLLRPQWFVRCRDLADRALKAVEDADSEGVSFEQDTDVLDTWFSSALLPFSTSGWPKATSADHYPLELMETGHDILFFWVARMVMLGQELTGKLPFRKILLHGIICDEYGRKMSKSLGNVIKPEHVIHGITLDRLRKEAEESNRQGLLSEEELSRSIAGQRKMFPNGIPECGTDALRFTLCSSNIKNHFIHFNVQEAHTNKLFFNKIWQATRYTLSCLERFLPDQDVPMETTKIYMKPDHAKTAALQCAILKHCISVGLYHMEPFTPFLAKELLTHLPLSAVYASDGSQAILWIDSVLESNVERMLDICQYIRQSKNEYTTPIVRKHNPIVHIFAKCNELHEMLHSQLATVQQLTLCNGVVLHREEGTFNGEQMVIKSAASHDCTIGIVAEGLELSKPAMDGTRKKLAKLEADIEKLLATINNEGYRKSASDVVQRRHQERNKAIEFRLSLIVRIRQATVLVLV
uniref:valine--tRNA ligase n=1 Tax=Anopheles atroparvus TaxID=41427 RepID=A0A182J499_ANOAO